MKGRYLFFAVVTIILPFVILMSAVTMVFTPAYLVHEYKSPDFPADPYGFTLEERIDTLVRRIYRGNGISVLPAAKKQMDRLTALGYGNLPVCVAKTQYSFSDDPKLLGAPDDFTVTVRQVKVSAGAGFIVVLAGKIMTMPGLPKVPAAENIDIDENGEIVGIF